MKIAVCVVGQPRFYKNTIESFRQEFYDFPGHDVDVFMHCWSDVGNSPEDDIEDHNEKNEVQSLKDDIWNTYSSSKSYLSLVVEDPEETFGLFCDSLSNVLNTLRLDKWLDDTTEDWRKHLGKIPIKTAPGVNSDKTSIRISTGRSLRYSTGQFYSLGKAIELKSWHEKENNFKYDLVIKTRTDLVFRPKELYENEEDYYKEKEDYYFQGLRKNKRGVFGSGLTILTGFHDEGKMKIALESLEIEKGKITNITPVKEDPFNMSLRADNILESSTLPAYPWRFFQQDWHLFSDSESADAGWSTLLSSYMSHIARDINRFTSGKEMYILHEGESIYVASALSNDVNLYTIKGSTRTFKVVNPDPSKRKDIRCLGAKKGQKKIPDSIINNDTPENMLNSLLKVIKEKYED